MHCEEFLDRCDRLEQGRRMGFGLRYHRASCPSCRATLLRQEAALAAYRSLPELPGGGRVEELLEDRIMTAVRLLPRPHRQVGLRAWLVAGGLIALSIVLIPLGSAFDLFRALFGTSYSLPLALVLGLVLAAYGALFVASHMRELGLLIRRS